MKKPVILIIDDEWGRSDDSEFMRKFQSLPFGFRLESSGERESYSKDIAIYRIKRESKDVSAILLDVMFGDEALGLEILREARELYPVLPILMLTSLTSSKHRSILVRAMELGANEYIEKVPEASRLVAILDAYVDPLRDDALYGNSRGMRRLRAQIADLSFGADASVLVVGDSGTGKELVAKAIHRQGLRRYGAFIAKNCAHSESQLLDSELFGHEKGAFTGAIERQTGLIEEADKGVLFLDEIADMPLQLQAKLLRVLETRTFRRVGGREDLKSDFQLICATNRDPAELIKEGKLRQDLYYRICTMTLHAPALREHRDDIPAYVELFVKKFRARGGASYPGETFTKDALSRLAQYDWPGNVRELRNVVERAIILSRTPEINHECLPPEISGIELAPASTASGIPTFQDELPADPAAWPKHRLLAELRLAVEAKRRIQEYKGSQWKAEFVRLMYPHCKAANAKGFDDLIRRLTKGPWGDPDWVNHDDLKMLIEDLKS